MIIPSLLLYCTYTLTFNQGSSKLRDFWQDFKIFKKDFHCFNGKIQKDLQILQDLRKFNNAKRFHKDF